MDWADEGIVIGVRRHGEANAVVELMTRERGRHLGMVRGGAGTRMRPLLQPGNSVQAVWRARLDQHLGLYAVEGLTLRAARLIGQAHALYALTHVTGLARLLPERDPHPGLFEALAVVLDGLDDASVAAALVVRFELEVLKELGFGLDLSQCAASGETGDLAYVSPKTGRAVSRTAGEPWRDRLLPLPAFLIGGAAPDNDAVADAFRVTGHFLQRDVYGPRGLAVPDARAAFLASLERGRITGT
jgi:DNA repair protein RecO (recombination protein O)